MNRYRVTVRESIRFERTIEVDAASRLAAEHEAMNMVRRRWWRRDEMLASNGFKTSVAQHPTVEALS